MDLWISLATFTSTSFVFVIAAERTYPSSRPPPLLPPLFPFSWCCCAFLGTVVCRIFVVCTMAYTAFPGRLPPASFPETPTCRHMYWLFHRAADSFHPCCDLYPPPTSHWATGVSNALPHPLGVTLFFPRVIPPLYGFRLKVSRYSVVSVKNGSHVVESDS